MRRIIQNTTKQSSSAASLTTDAIVTTTGKSIIALVSCFDNLIGTFSDSGGHSWTADIASIGNTKGWMAIFRCHNITGSGAHTFTIASSGGNTFFAITLWEVEGLVNAAPNHTNNASANSTSHSSGSISADAGVIELMFGGGALSAAAELTPTVTNAHFGWSRRGLNATASAEGIIAGVAFVPAGSSESFDYTTSNAQFETALIAGYKTISEGAGGASSVVIMG